MKDLKSFLIESTEWVSTSTDDRYGYGNKSSKKEDKPKYNATEIKLEDITGEEKQDVAIWVLNSGRMGNIPYHKGEKEIFNKLKSKYKGNNKFLSFACSGNGKLFTEEITSIDKIAYGGAHPYLFDVLNYISDNKELIDKDCNIFITDWDLLDPSNVSKSNLLNKIKEVSDKTKLIFYSICENKKDTRYRISDFEELIEPEKFEINYIIIEK